MKRCDPSYYYYNALNSNDENNFSTFLNNRKNSNDKANVNMNDNNNNDFELLNQDEFIFISYVTVTQKGLLQKLANVLGDPEILDDDPQVMEAILEWYFSYILFFAFFLFIISAYYLFIRYFVFRYEMRNEQMDANRLRISVLGAINIILEEFEVCQQIQQDFM